MGSRRVCFLIMLTVSPHLLFGRCAGKPILTQVAGVLWPSYLKRSMPTSLHYDKPGLILCRFLFGFEFFFQFFPDITDFFVDQTVFYNSVNMRCVKYLLPSLNRNSFYL